MKKSELRQLIREELSVIRESGLPTQQQIKQSKKNTELFNKAEAAHKKLLAFLKTWDRAVGQGDPTDKQVADIEKAYNTALKDIRPFLNSDSNAIITHGTAAQKLHKNVKTTLDGIKYMLDM